jgi:hypothetical protein
MRLLILMMLALACAGQNETKVKLMNTNGEFNGLYWQEITEDQKLMFVTGFLAGVRDRTVPGGDFTCKPVIMFWDLLPKGTTYGRIISEVDSFYSTAPNVPFPLDTALVYSLAKLNGVSAEELQKYRSLMLNAIENGLHAK